MADIINNIANLIMYIVTGCLFLWVFRIKTLHERPKESEHILVESIVFGYIHTSIMHLIPYSINPQIDNIGIIFAAIILGYLTACISDCKIVIQIMEVLKIYETSNHYIWHELLDKHLPYKVVIQFDDYSVEGYVRFFSEFTDKPLVALCSYTVYDQNGDVKDLKKGMEGDRTDCKSETFLVDTSKAKNIRFIYDDNSSHCEDIARFVKMNTSQES